MCDSERCDGLGLSARRSFCLRVPSPRVGVARMLRRVALEHQPAELSRLVAGAHLACLTCPLRSNSKTSPRGSLASSPPYSYPSDNSSRHTEIELLPRCRFTPSSWLLTAPFLLNSALTTSADVSPLLGHRCRRPTPDRPEKRGDLQGKVSLLPSGPAEFIRARVRVEHWASPSTGRVPSPRRPSIRILFVRSELRLRPPFHPPSRRRSCLWPAVPPTGPAEGLHLQRRHHAWHTTKEPPEGGSSKIV
jgi:hypothetical protein